MSSNDRAKVQSRQERFSDKIKTKITNETVDSDNPFLATRHAWYGYDSIELAKRCDFTDTLFLLLTGNLPSLNQKQLLNFLMVSMANAGPRHPAVRAGVNAAVGKTLPEHFLPISLSVLGGNKNGAGEVQFAMRFIRNQLQENNVDAIDELVNKSVPGFGSRYGSPDPYIQSLLTHIKSMPSAGAAVEWGAKLNEIMLSKGQGLSASGLCASVFLDLGVGVYQAAALYQLIFSPGIIAHSAEYAREPRTSLPFVSDDNYEIK